MGLFVSRRPMEELVNEHYQSLYRYAYRLCGSLLEAEDLTQEAFCKAQKNWKQLRDPKKAQAWLFRILRNAYLQGCRQSQKRQAISLECIGEVPELPSGLLPEIDPEDLQAALNELPEAFRTPLILYYFNDFSYRSIAEQLEVPIGTVMSRLARGKAYIRERLLAAELAIH